MNKQEFLAKLQTNLSGLPEKEVQDSLGFYSEMIDDRMEEGLSEEDAVKAIGPIENIVAQIITDTSLTTLVKEKIKPKKRMKAWEIVLLVLGSPIWLSLLISAVAVILSVYISLWAVVISLWAVLASLIARAFAGTVAGIGFICTGKLASGIFMIGCALVCAGVGIFFFCGCHWTTKGTLWLAKAFFKWIKRLFIWKEEA